MRKIFTTILVSLIFLLKANMPYAQTLPDFDLIKLDKVSDFKNAEPFALQTARFLLSTPFQKKNERRVKALEFLFKWMHGTPDYSFNFNDAKDISKDNTDILGAYMAAMVKYTLENKTEAKDPKQAKLNSIILLLDYCSRKENNIPMNKPLKKLAEAKEKGQLEQSL